MFHPEQKLPNGTAKGMMQMALSRRMGVSLLAISAFGLGSAVVGLASQHAAAQTVARAQVSERVTETRLEGAARTQPPAITALQKGASGASDLGAAILAHLNNLARAESVRENDDITAIKAFYAMRDGAPLWFTPAGINNDGLAVLHVLKTAGAFGLDGDEYAIPLAVLADIENDAAKADLEIAITKRALAYAQDARGARVDPSQLSYEIFVERPLIAPSTILTDLLVAKDRAAYLQGLHPKHEQFALLKAALAERRATDRTGLKRREVRRLDNEIERISLNMEFWRWLPESLGARHVIANIPEFRVRLFKDGDILFSERVIVGKPSTQTPLFSDEMDHLIFRPFWGVPNSIKVKKLLPGLLRGRDAVAANGLKLKRGSRYVSARSIDWSRNDIRNFAVYQPPGPGNALGNVKFMFPNKHAIYMHDTPSKHLFNSKQRLYSAGCVRVRNPDEFAKVLLKLSNGWPEARTAAAFKRGPDDDRVDFDTKLPVHIGYFTAWVDPKTKDVAFFDDVYKHERHLRFALAGDYNRIVRVKRSVAADIQSIRESVEPVSDRGTPGSFWFGSRGSSGAANVPRSVWAREAFSSDN
jgi:murein L,D-transpeptidase YcbB/YkuD